MKEFFIILAMIAVVLIGPAQCTYDNYVKYQLSQAAKKSSTDDK